ncbi:dehydratase [Pseudonocardia xishanensis]|uniref:MaoC family dehydratase n=1 Tax=Pseudonocardia xishanensis TaxID=630995 RepID=A0ABP8RGX8_9PSEU
MSGPLRVSGAADLEAAAGKTLGPSPWQTVGPARAEAFAAATGGRTSTGEVAQFLTLSLVPRLLNRVRTVENVRMGVNYGVDGVRFPAAVRVGARVRGRARIVEVKRLPGDAVQVVTRVTVDFEHSAEPACVADLVVRYYFDVEAPSSHAPS